MYSLSIAKTCLPFPSLCAICLIDFSIRLDRRDAINLNISHRVVLSAYEVLFVKDGSVALRVDRTHRFQARLENRASLAVIPYFPRNIIYR